MGTVIKARQRFTESQLADLVQSLDNGGTICMATDTVYGLSCAADSEEAVMRLAGIKGSGSRPFLLLIGERSWIERLVAEIPASAETLMSRYWPGPLTLVFKARGDVPPWLRGARDTVAVRCPRSSLCEQLLKKLRHPLVSSSANVEGETVCVNGEKASRTFLEQVDFVVDSGRAPTKLPSTIVDVTLIPPTVVRQGAVRVDGELLSQMGAG